MGNLMTSINYSINNAHTCPDTHMHAYGHARAYPHAQVHIPTYMHACAHTLMPVHMPTHACGLMDMCAHARMHTCLHTRMLSHSFFEFYFIYFIANWLTKLIIYYPFQSVSILLLTVTDIFLVNEIT